ncbi:larval cuticle protein LCP-30-like [Eriocheir sinensis]|uniref:larval cuticle protein LCP-30-like n=1 Tax=Eriocheir sinensis TaxID=95602 RepID=UPI0021C652D1|nr:larval cuticle protein LCP-30-like [Eriocheir sinensis]
MEDFGSPTRKALYKRADTGGRHSPGNRHDNMLFVTLAALVSVAAAATQYAPPPPGSYEDSRDFIPILKDNRVQEDDGRYNLDVETGNGIFLSQSGAPDGPEGAVIKAGEFSYTAPDGTPVHVKFVADENGYQPQSDLLPVAPEFPHPIPQFVLDQIAFAAEEDARRPKTPSGTYSAPIILATLAVVAAAAPQQYYDNSREVVPILKDERQQDEYGRYNLDVETGNGIVLAQSGSPDGPEGSVVKAGQYAYTAPDGTPVVVKFVADENGYQPQSPLLPVAPEFPHPIPQFVLDQIAKAAEEDANRSREDRYD